MYLQSLHPCCPHPQTPRNSTTQVKSQKLDTASESQDLDPTVFQDERRQARPAYFYDHGRIYGNLLVARTGGHRVLSPDLQAPSRAILLVLRTLFMDDHPPTTFYHPRRLPRLDGSHPLHHLRQDTDHRAGLHTLRHLVRQYVPLAGGIEAVCVYGVKLKIGFIILNRLREVILRPASRGIYLRSEQASIHLLGGNGLRSDAAEEPASDRARIQAKWGYEFIRSVCRPLWCNLSFFEFSWPTWVGEGDLEE
ncbi:hypothetical protein BO82DRAFT_411916 [Aspergillus uvarum CBS 121591]|uniref:Uncharacterized protein n=1 Tax=Aspergillus uvarum CBS 121591 TaxID=1448315 RepID=A0A319CJM2_9EURO|nr:hypothetical protein BO82DRAFT_411916 [Aspergillus uvarum CBS 121591]PYH83367.1 hypothetical protein BO82DRAFT_411916 [Aspergillus uvarum CBS 121591]